MLTEIITHDDRWNTHDLARLAERAARAVLDHQALDAAQYEIAVLACDNARIAQLNGEFRDKSRPTNVLSWPEEELAPAKTGAFPAKPEQGDADDPHHLGDIALAFETCAQEATDQGKTFEAHVAHLIVHAVLHLLGYDHIRDEDATLMESAEIEILGNLGLPDPYRE